MSTLIDSNILLDLFTKDEEWYSWSSKTLSEQSQLGSLYINPIIYSEVSVHFKDPESLEKALPSPSIKRDNIPYQAAFIAGKCFARYRKAGGAKNSPLPDFYIGAHAMVRDWKVITRDKGRFSTYFPTLEIISP